MQKPKLQADKIYATYWWEIHLDHNDPRNYNAKVKMLTGYSKFQGHDEAKDKIHMLMRKILMLATNGYLERSKRIQMYKRTANMVDKTKDIHLFTLYPKDYELGSAVVPGMDRYKQLSIDQVVVFLDKLYGNIRDGKQVAYLLPKPETNFSKDDYFKIENHSFPTRRHLYNWAEKQIKSGHSFAQVSSFVFKYIERYFPHELNS